MTKTVGGNAGETSREFSFTVTLTDRADFNGTYDDMTFTGGVATFTLKHGETANATGLPAGAAYTVVETAVDGYTTTKTGDTGTIPAGSTAEAHFNNTKNINNSINEYVTVSVEKAWQDEEGNALTDENIPESATFVLKRNMTYQRPAASGEGTGDSHPISLSFDFAGKASANTTVTAKMEMWSA